MHKKIKNKIGRYSVVLLSLVLIVIATAGGTIAYLFATAGPVTNTFTIAPVEITIDEEFDGTAKSNVRIQNTGETKAYIRAKVLINWVDSNDNIVTSVPNGYSYTIDWGDIDTTTSKWKTGNDGFYYYTDEIPPTTYTEYLIDSATYIKPTEIAEYFLKVDIIAQAIQSTPTDAIEESWGETAISVLGLN